MFLGGSVPGSINNSVSITSLGIVEGIRCISLIVDSLASLPKSYSRLCSSNTKYAVVSWLKKKRSSEKLNNF